MEAPVSIREFARMIGLSNTAVSKAIKNGSISGGVARDSDGKEIGIYASMASREWGKPFLTPQEAPAETDPDDVTDYAMGIPDHTSKIEAERLIAVYKARKARLEAMEIEGDLVNRGLVYSRLYELGNIIRDAILNVPDRCIDDVLAADGRNAAIILLSKELSDALILLSDTASFEITPKR